MQLNRALSRAVLPCVLASVAATLYGCQDSPIAPGRPPANSLSQSAAAINAPGDSAAPEIMFLAPLGPKSHPRGELDTTLAPSVAICRLANGHCGVDTLAVFHSDSTADSTQRILMNEHAFYVRWNTKALLPDTSITYRIVVTLGDTTVGFTDVRIVAPEYTPLPEDTLQYAFINPQNWLRVRFQIFLPPATLTVISEPGVSGNLTSQSYTFRRGSRVSYNFSADSGYTNALVTLDQQPIQRRGIIRMDDSHVLIASADRNTDIARGDEWILRDARAVLRASDKVAAAQKLLDSLDVMTDTANIAERLQRVELTLVNRDQNAEALAELDAALDGHALAAGSGEGERGDIPGNGGGGGGGIATSLLVPLTSPSTLRPSPTIMTPMRGMNESLTIAYVNGILTTPLGALFAAHHVAMAARSAQWYANVPYDVKLIYNRSAMADDAIAEDRCVLELGIKGGWLGLNSLPKALAKCLNTTEPKALAMLADYAEAGNELVSVMNRSTATRPPDVDTVAAFANRMRDEGRHVVFVMHSQGNLVVQQALMLLRTRGQYSQATDTTCIGGVALAAPTSDGWPISARHLHGLVVDGDAILVLGKNHFPRVRTAMSDSALLETTGSVRARIVSLATAARLRWGVRLHSVVESYLSQAPMRGRIQDAIVSAYKGCALGEIRVMPQTLQLKTGESGVFHTTLADLNGDALDGKRGITWNAHAEGDWQRAVSVTSAGVAQARYVGGTTVTASGRTVTANGGVVVDPAPLSVVTTETLSAQWVLLYTHESVLTPTPVLVVPSTGWDGGSCTEKLTLVSADLMGKYSKQCYGDYRVTTDPFPNADKYEAAFFGKGATAAMPIVSRPTPSIPGHVGGPMATTDMLAGPAVIDRVTLNAFDAFGHLLASGVGCVHGCVGW